MPSGLIFLPIAVNEKEHKAVEGKSDSIGSNNRNITGYDAVNHPQGQPGDQHEEHPWRHIIHLFRFPGLPNLRSDRGSSENSGSKA